MTEQAKKSGVDWVVIGRATCPFTIQAIETLEDEDEEFIFLDIEASPKDRKTYEKEYRKKVPKNFNTVPQIFYKGRFIGGYDALDNFLVSKENLSIINSQL